MINFVVQQNLAGKTFKEFFEIQHFSAEQIKRYKFYGEISVNGQKVAVTYVLRLGDIVKLSTNKRLETPEFAAEPAKVLFADNYLYVAEKPYGTAIHPDRAHPNGTLGNALATYFGEGFELRIVTRLDKTTSGLVLGALDEITAQRLNEMQLHHEIEKQYIAVVEGHFEQTKGQIALPLLRDDQHNKTLVNLGGKEALTEYTVLRQQENFAKLLVVPKTGRTHQIRAHLAAIGHPIVGDALYGAKAAPRIMLHCQSLSFLHPTTGEKLQFFSTEIASQAGQLFSGD